MYINQWRGMGFISQEPKQTEKSVRFSVYTKRSYKKGDEWVEVKNYPPCVAMGIFLEKAKKLQKGDFVYIEGEINTGSYEDKEGNKKYTTDVIVSHISVIPLKEKEGEGEAPKAKKSTTSEDSLNLDDLPF